MRTRSLLALITIATLVLFVLAVRGALLWKQHVAAAYLSDVGKLKSGLSSYADVERLRNAYESQSSVSKPCTAQHCAIEFSIGNDWLSRLHLANPAFLRSTVTVDRDRLTRIVTLAACYPHNSGPYTVSVWEEEGNWGGHSLSVGGNTEALVVRVSPSAAPQDREAAFHLNTRFLSDRSACTKPGDLLPTMASCVHSPIAE